MFRPAERLQNKLADVIDGACGEIRVQTAADKTAVFDCNHLLITLEYDQRAQEVGELWNVAEAALRQCEKYLIKHRITEVEIAFPKVQGKNSTRVVYINETGAISEINTYKVIVNGKKDNILQSVRSGFARFEGKSCYAPHRPIANVNVQKKRYQAHRVGTTYVYDFPVVIARATLELWNSYKRTDPKSYER